MVFQRAYIYKLYSESSESVYIGKAMSVRRRLKEHLNEAKKPRLPRQLWINKIIQAGGEVKLQILKSCDAKDVNFYEMLFISLYKNLGIKLKNVTDGGDGISGFKHTEETKRKISESNTGKKMSPGYNHYLHQVVIKGRKAPFPERLRISARLIDNKFRVGKEPANKGKRRLSLVQIEEIKVKLKLGFLGRELAKEYSVPESTISCIRNGKYLEAGWGYKSSAESWKNKSRETLQDNLIYLFS